MDLLGRLIAEGANPMFAFREDKFWLSFGPSETYSESADSIEELVEKAWSIWGSWQD